MSQHRLNEMHDDVDDEPIERPRARAETWRCLKLDLLLALFVATVHANGIWGAFVFDDPGSIVRNESIRDLSNPFAILFGATFTTVVDRPMLNLSLAINYALGGIDPFGYHIFNILVHSINAILVARLVRVLFSASSAPAWVQQRSELWSVLVAALWGSHPLVTAAVCYVVQRAESMMAMFLLAALLLLEKSSQSPHAVMWRVGSVACFLLSLATKEVAVMFPVIAMVFDRSFIAQDWSTLVKRRWRYYVTTFGLSLMFAIRTLLFSGGRDGTAGLDAPVPVAAYLTSQCVFITDYLRLALIPIGQAFDWGVLTITDPIRWGPRLAILAILAGLTCWGTVRGQRWAFGGWWLFGLLAPTALIPVATQVAAEHRMYLPLLAVVVGVILLLRGTVGRRSERWAIAVVCLAIGICACLTIRRNSLYASPLALWADSAANRPENPRSYNNAMMILRDKGRYEEAIGWVNRALEIPSVRASRTRGINWSTSYTTWLSDRGLLFWKLGKNDAALTDFSAALEGDPNLPQARFNRATVYFETQKFNEALADINIVLSRRPRAVDALDLRGRILLRMGRVDEAEATGRLLNSLEQKLSPEFLRELEDVKRNSP